jgi:hypothetical protein
MSVPDIDIVFDCACRYLKPYIFSHDGSKKPFHGKIPINLDSPFNMGDKALERCNPNLDITWSQLLDNLTITIMWKGDIPQVIVHHYHEIYNFFYSAEKDFKSLQLLLYNFMLMLMTELTKPTTEEEAPLCVCLWDHNSRKADIVIDLDELMVSTNRNKRTFDQMDL